MRIAMIGSRGLPATYGGIEHHVEEIGSRLVQRGHDVTVYSRRNYVGRESLTHLGMEVRSLPTVGTKHLDAIVHSAVSTADALRCGFDVLHYHAVGPAVLSGPARAADRRATVVATVHGLDSRRGKWGGGATAALRSAEWLAVRTPHETVVVSRDLKRHFADAYGRRTTLLANGVNAPAPADLDLLSTWGLRPGSYVLFVGRLVPEKAPDLLVRAFAEVPGDVRLVLAGGTSFSDDFVQRLRALSELDSRVLMPGYVYGDRLSALYAGAAAFVLPSSVEGLPLTLLEAASYGTPVVASNIPPHLEVLGAIDAPGCRAFRSGEQDELRDALTRVLHDPAAERRGGQLLQADVLERYSWERVVNGLERVYACRVVDAPEVTRAAA